MFSKMTLQSLRVIVRIIVPSSSKVVKSVATSTQRFYHHNALKNVTSSICLNKRHTHRFLSQKSPPIAEDFIVDYDYVKKATADHSILIVDVREPEEVQEHGKIPNSINIPLSNVVPVLSNLTENEFSQLYERRKPQEDTEMIFYCMIGKRSGKAQQNAINLGYKNTKNYLGSWTDWATKTQ